MLTMITGFHTFYIMPRRQLQHADWSYMLRALGHAFPLITEG